LANWIEAKRIEKTNEDKDLIVMGDFNIPSRTSPTKARSWFGTIACTPTPIGGRCRKAGRNPFALRMVEEELKPVPSKGWAAMIRKVYEVDPMVCPKRGGTMKVVAFITDYAAVDRIIDHLKLTFVAEKPPPSRVLTEVALMAAEERAEYF